MQDKDSKLLPAKIGPFHVFPCAMICPVVAMEEYTIVSISVEKDV